MGSRGNSRDSTTAPSTPGDEETATSCLTKVASSSAVTDFATNTSGEDAETSNADDQSEESSDSSAEESSYISNEITDFTSDMNALVSRGETTGKRHKRPMRVSSDELSSSLRVMQWLEGSRKSYNSVKEMLDQDETIESSGKYRKEQGVLVKQSLPDTDEAASTSTTVEQTSKTKLTSEAQDNSLRGPLSIRPSYLEFLSKISDGKSDLKPEELDMEWPPSSTLFVEKQPVKEAPVPEPIEIPPEPVEVPPEKPPKTGKKSKTKKSKSTVTSVKKKGKESVKTPEAKKGKPKPKKDKAEIASKSGKSLSITSKRSSKAPAKAAVKRRKTETRPSLIKDTADGKSKSGAQDGKKPLHKKSVDRRITVLPENVRGPLKSVSDSKTKLILQEQAKCSIPAAIHLYYGERADFLTEGELEEIRQRLNTQTEDRGRVKRIPLISSTVHKQIMRHVAFCLKVKPSKVEDGVLDFDSHIELLDSIMTAGGRRMIIFSFHKYGPKGE